MSDVQQSFDAHQILDAVLTGAPEASGALATVRPEVLAQTRSAYDALYRAPQALPARVLHALAAVTADWQGSGVLADWHRAQGASPELTAADPLSSDPALAALRDQVDLLSISPALATLADQQQLTAVGHDSRTVVLISQLVAFESYLQRLVAGLAALHGLDLPSADAPTRTPRSRGRVAAHGGATPTGRTRPAAFTRDQLQWEPWIPVPSEDELTEEQRASFASKASTNSVYFRMLSLTPGVTRARSELDNAIFLPRDGMPKAERELAAAVTSKVNDCIYCASVHARKAAGFSKREEEVDALLAAQLERNADWISADLAPLAEGQDERWSAIVTAAAELSRPRPALGAAHLEALRAQGLDDHEITDLLTASAFFAWANRLMLSLGDPSLPDAA
ncbi:MULTISPECIES: peroxidase-related enzyme [Brachybacterium]|uniref:Alkylhydroperoxidase n=2 Tax=Brachybacterium TaxID=43668 RepID=A0A426SMY6_9MICO|nr:MULTISPECIES: peroxidase-related enzyme [Brachybacterium]MCT1436132.1 peroxidase-related enzyme [Brachybacterium paraconglomeratum]RRR19543.1 alkylhydroperoxidase [Brachybacterium paraconglomeratum]GLI31205.1 alkyl hydroperoxide reductase AhpD [Brachybacterium conglomeratum]GLK04117.1 alkyl hydroperoxide reductase AhpD [Brachybacterium conglomeratum]